MTKALLKFIRLPNLIIVILTQYLLLHSLLLPFLENENISPSLDALHFFLFALDTVLITLSGNVINDIVDEPIDRINRPSTVFVNRYISIRKAYLFYSIVVAVGLALALYLAFYLNKLPLVIIYPIAVALLYFYSTVFKQRAFIGNLIVSLFCGGVAVIVLFAERDAYFQLSSYTQNTVWKAFAAYALFAFLTTLFREIVKDLEDMKGDAERGCKTLPIVWGVTKTRTLAMFIGATTMVFVLAFICYLFLAKYAVIYWLYPTLLSFAPLAYVLFLLQKADTPKKFHTISSAMKWVMLLGLLYLTIS